MDGRRVIGVKNRERLLASAIEVFAQRGYRGTTTRELAAAAGVTERTLFRQFPTKAALFQEAVAGPVERFFTDFRDSWAVRPRGSRDSETEIREFFSSLRAVLEAARRDVALIVGLGWDPRLVGDRQRHRGAADHRDGVLGHRAPGLVVRR